MAANTSGRRLPTKPKRQARLQKRKRDDVDVEKLEQNVAELDTEAIFSKFTELPLSEPTKAGLKHCHFSELTNIQAKAIALGLKYHDILGAAKTGSGKTLAFLVPVLENLYRRQCVGPDAGLGAMIIAPTRELAIQIFEVLRKIGGHGHLFAAGLIIGGKSLQDEQHALGRMNIVVCTPGRMLQHLSQTAAFSIDNLQMLVLDEADRIMDMGFQRDVDSIIEYLPSNRQTLLFSATQTKNVSDLARLSLRDPKYISVHEQATNATPMTLQQNYVITPLPSKLDTLWSFLQSGKKSKILVFLSSGKQVRFVYESFRRLQPGISLLHLHGRQRQSARLEITTRFSAAKHVCLFATDVVARGLDFSAVDWVVQVDCPEDAETYIHRVGRTARYERDGRAVLFLDPSEEKGMLERLEFKKVPIERINIRAKKQQSIKSQLQAMCFKDPELKYLGQKAFSSYVRSINIQKDKEIFQVESYALEEFASSLGLPGAPHIRFLKGDIERSKRAKNASRHFSPDDEDPEGGQRSDSYRQDKPVRTKYDRMFERVNQDILSSHYSRMINNRENEDLEDSEHINSPREPNAMASGSSNGVTASAASKDNAERADISNASNSQDKDDGLFTVKRRYAPLLDSIDRPSEIHDAFDEREKLIIDSQRRVQALKSKRGVAKLLGSAPSRLIFGEDGTPHHPNPFEDEGAIGRDEKEREEARRRFLEAEQTRFKTSDVSDKRMAKEKKREKKERQRLRDVDRNGEGPPQFDDTEMEDTFALEQTQQPFEELADLYEDEKQLEGAVASTLPEPSGAKKEKKWFEHGLSDSEADTSKKRTKQRNPDPETLEDLEEIAAGFLE